MTRLIDALKRIEDGGQQSAKTAADMQPAAPASPTTTAPVPPTQATPTHTTPTQAMPTPTSPVQAKSEPAGPPSQAVTLSAETAATETGPTKMPPRDVASTPAVTLGASMEARVREVEQNLAEVAAETREAPRPAPVELQSLVQEQRHVEQRTEATRPSPVASSTPRPTQPVEEHARAKGTSPVVENPEPDAKEKPVATQMSAAVPLKRRSTLKHREVTPSPENSISRDDAASAPLSLRELVEGRRSSAKIADDSKDAAERPPEVKSTTPVKPEEETAASILAEFAASLPQDAHGSKATSTPGDEVGLAHACENLLSRMRGTGRTLLAFACVDHNDAHATAVQDMAATMAGKLDDPVLVIDASTSLKVGVRAGISNVRRLDELAAEGLAWQELVVQTTTPGLCVLPLNAGADVADDPVSVARLLKTISEQYPCVLIDLGGCETMTIGPLLDCCDGTVLLVESQHTPAEEAANAIRRLSAVRPPVLGTLLVQREAVE